MLSSSLAFFSFFFQLTWKYQLTNAKKHHSLTQQVIISHTHTHTHTDIWEVAEKFISWPRYSHGIWPNELNSINCLLCSIYTSSTVLESHCSTKSSTADMTSVYDLFSLPITNKRNFFKSWYIFIRTKKF